MPEQSGDAALALRVVFPRWYLLGAIVTFVVVVLVSVTVGGGGAGAVVAAFWVPLISAVVAERRRSSTTRSRDEVGVRESGWWEPVTAAGFTVVAIGVALAVGNSWPTLRPALLLSGLIMLAVGGLFFICLLRVRRSR